MGILRCLAMVVVVMTAGFDQTVAHAQVFVKGETPSASNSA